MDAKIRRALARWRESDLSLSEFSRRQNISYHKLVYWRKREDPVEPEAEFVPVTVTELPTEADALSVQLGNGVIIEVPEGFCEDELVRLAKALRSC